MKKCVFNNTRLNFRKLFLPGFLTLVSGCRANSEIEFPRMKNTEPPVSISYSVSSDTAVLPSPKPVGFDLRFIFTQPLTNCYLQSSTDLIHWQNRYDFTVDTNVIDGTNVSYSWSIQDPIPVRPSEFYRAAGESIP